jgi:TP901-1 family phage major tail protein
MAEILNGSDLMLFIGTGAAAKTIAFATSHKVSIKRGTRETSSKDSGKWTSKKASRMDWTITADAGYTNDAASFSYQDLYALMVAGTPVDVASCLATGTAPGWVKAATDVYSGKAIITALDKDAKDNDNVTFSITLEGDGEYAYTAV